MVKQGAKGTVRVRVRVRAEARVRVRAGARMRARARMRVKKLKVYKVPDNKNLEQIRSYMSIPIWLGM